jgi:LacI family transcriptional regulator
MFSDTPTEPVATPPRVIRVAVVLPSVGLRDGEILRGIRAYASPDRRWWLQVVGETRDDLRGLRGWRADGVVGVLRDRAAAAELLSWGVPLVNVSNAIPPDELDVPRVAGDDVQVGALAARYFLDRGFRHFAMFEEPVFWWSACRRRGYEETLRADGMRCSVHSDPVGTAPRGGGASLKRRQQALVAWAKALPKPAALFVVNDYRARDLLEIVRGAGLEVPTDLAVVGVENDASVCEVAFPPLSSVATDARRIGYEAAAALAELLAGRPLVQRHRYLAPPGVVTRQSSELLATADPDVQAAVRYIRGNVNRRIGVPDVVLQTAVSRRQLERRFATHLGRSVLEEIHRARIDLAKRLLVDTDMPMTAIAARAGFASPQRFNTTFRGATDLTPTQYRRAFRLGG